MPACETCNAPTVKSETGTKCMNPTCESHKSDKKAGDQTNCPKCESPMSYQGLNSWGEPNYTCVNCGNYSKL